MFYLTGRAVTFNQSHDINYCGYCSQILEGTLMVPCRQTAAHSPFIWSLLCVVLLPKHLKEKGYKARESLKVTLLGRGCAYRVQMGFSSYAHSFHGFRPALCYGR